MSSYSRYWPFRSRTPSSSAAPRGRLEEESDTLGVRDEATRREGVAAPSPAGPAKPAGPRASGVVTHQVAASASRAEPPRAPSTSALRDLLISVERATVEEKDEDEPRSTRTPSPRIGSSGSSPRSLSPPAQPGVALQETPVFAAQAVVIKRARSGEASRIKRTNSMLSRAVGRDGEELPSIRRSHSWSSRHGGVGNSDEDVSPGSESPLGASPRR